MTKDTRETKRRATNRAGIIKAAGREMTVVLRNSSKSGACLRLVAAGEIPDTFRLVSPMEKIDADCVVVWRRGRDCGIKFAS
ncbi:MAG: PilZ domain-containing protein [Hyphomicrobium sp.]|jgi:hypothetical protein|uniref:PilZ domain-containing protein n=1 Tax=Hyphomicrobium sp. TaxID=82 RepID=UPI0025BB00B1|nr:PilZ domain-containing protein [Hyphomicrobium sp.]MBX9862267.1 PilZ domain-containing protein [Hyphomicrobium sp.]